MEFEEKKRYLIKEYEGVYAPHDDTFLMLQCVEVDKGDKVLEMGCGTGIVAIHCARRGAEVTAVDINPVAVECALRNAELNRVALRTIRSDLFSHVPGRYDLVLFNPPYLPVQEEGGLEAAWSGGRGGLEVVQRFLGEAIYHLRPGGRLLLLVSSRMDETALECMISHFQWRTLGSRRFFFENLRVLELISS